MRRNAEEGILCVKPQAGKNAEARCRFGRIVAVAVIEIVVIIVLMEGNETPAAEEKHECRGKRHSAKSPLRLLGGKVLSAEDAI